MNREQMSKACDKILDNNDEPAILRAFAKVILELQQIKTRLDKLEARNT